VIRETTSIDLNFFFQAEDGIRDSSVTGVQTCALPIYALPRSEGERDRQESRGTPPEQQTSPHRPPPPFSAGCEAPVGVCAAFNGRRGISCLRRQADRNEEEVNNDQPGRPSRPGRP